MRIATLSLVASAAALLTAHSAHAVLQISIDINGTTVTCADNAACDTNPAVGQLQLANQIVAGVEVLGSAQTQTVGPPTNILNTSSFQVVNQTGADATVQIAVSGTDFASPVATFSASSSGTFNYTPITGTGSTIDTTFFADTANTQGANTPTDLPGTQLADSGVFTANNPAGTEAFSFTDNGTFAANAAFSQSLGTTGLLTPGSTLTGRSQAIVTEVTATPEPASLALLGTGLLALFGLYRARRG